MDDDRPPWWDDAFSSLLLGLVPPGAATLVDVNCGTAHAADVLLEARDRLVYLGLDRDRALLAQAAERLSHHSFTPRVTLRVGAPDSLPLPDGTADVILLLMALTGEPDPAVVLDEARRALVPGGRLIAIEIDAAATRFTFAPLQPTDDELPDLNAAFATHLRAAGDLAPRLPSLLERAGLHVDTRVHALSVARRETLQDFTQRIHALFSDLKGGPVGGTPVPPALGWSIHHAPVIVAVGTRPES